MGLNKGKEMGKTELTAIMIEVISEHGSLVTQITGQPIDHVISVVINSMSTPNFSTVARAVKKAIPHDSLASLVTDVIGLRVSHRITEQECP